MLAAINENLAWVLQRINEWEKELQGVEGSGQVVQNALFECFNHI